MRSRQTDTSGLPSRRAVISAALLLVFAFASAVPWFANFATQRLLVEALTLFTVALAWNLLAGYGGLVAVGLHVFVGVGAYALFTLSNQLHLNPWLLLPAAAVVAVLFAMISAWPMFRLSGAHFAVGTWVLAEMMRILTLNTPWLGAGAGMPLEAMSAFDRWTRNAGVYWAALVVGVGALMVARIILRGPLGLALMSVRDSELAALASGVPVARAKVTLWIVCAAMAGLAGAVAYMNTLQVTPDASFSLNWTAAAIFIAVLGGIGTLEGPVIGTIIYFVLREFFAGYGAWYFIGIGLLAILMMVAAPGGVWSLMPEKWRLDPLRIRRTMPADEIPVSSACVAAN
jgi:branched-chain amino acid transport system permease protein